jgi:predicted phosphodiesterase
VRLAALYDIHGNLPALEATLDEVERAGIDVVVVGGDVVGGPFPAACLALLNERAPEAHFLRGNHESEVLAFAAGADMPEGPERTVARWAVEQLGADGLLRVASWPLTLSLRVGDLGRVLFCHATPTSDTAVFTRDTPPGHVAALFAGIDADVAVCGHTHMPVDRRVGPLRIVTAGSVGAPFGAAGAHWLVFEGGAGGGVAFQRTDYDLKAAAERISASAMPDAADVARTSVLDPPDEAQALAWLQRKEAEQRAGA